MKPCCARYAISLFAPIKNTRTQIRPISRILSSQTRAMSFTPIRYTSIPNELPGDEPDDVLFGSLYGVRTIELNRPKKLNSLNGSMARKIMPRLREYEKSQLANIIIMSGAGEKAFCAGGDVAELAKQNDTPEGQQKSCEYFKYEYQLDHLIATYTKPYVALIDGITMGGGVGLSVHAPFRIATERTVFAMPETTIGLFPDVGGGFFLPRLDGEIGTYLALTSERLQGVQVFYAGIATHYLDSSVLQSLTTRLSELQFQDYASLEDRLKLINSTISEFSSSLPSPDSYEKAKYGDIRGALRQSIDKCFGHNTVEEIISAVEEETKSKDPWISEWAKGTVKTLAIRSPTSMKVTLRQLRLGKNWDINETFVREHRMASRFMAHPDFTEGVTARLINRPPTQPKWNPATLAEVTDETIDEFFTLPPGEKPMRLIDPVNKGDQNKQAYKDYPYAAFALPREADIEVVVEENKGASEQQIIKKMLQKWNNKEGVAEKVRDVLQRGAAKNADPKPSPKM